MRIRLLVHPSLFGNAELTARREVLLLPETIALVGDLHHLLHSRLVLPTVVLRLSVDGFALLPLQRIEDVLRDEDVLEVQPASVSSASRKRSRDLAQPFLALADIAHHGLGEPAIAKASKAIRRAAGATGMLALPMTPEATPAVSRSVASVGMLALPMRRNDAPAITSIGAAGVPITQLPKTRQSIGSSPQKCPDVADTVASELASTSASTDACNPELQNIQVPPQQFAGPWPDPTVGELWMPLTREPKPWELIRFRSSGPQGLTDLRAARVVGVELGKDGPTYVLIGAGGAIERHFGDRLLQASIPKHLGKPSEAVQPQSEQQPHPEHGQQQLEQPQPQEVKATDAVQTQSQQPQPHPEHQQQQQVEQAQPQCESLAEPQESSESESESHQRPPCQQQSVTVSHAAASAPTPSRSLQSTRLAHKAVCEMMDASEKVGQGLSDEDLREAVCQQVAFYFGKENYSSDNWLRSQADFDGWTSLLLVSKFNRMRQLTRDFDLVFECVQMSDIVEVSECGEWVRQNPALRSHVDVRQARDPEANRRRKW